MRAAYHGPDALAAEATLEALARSLAKSHPGAAGSLREGLFETLTVTRLGVPPTLARTLRSTNAIESMIEICRHLGDGTTEADLFDHHGSELRAYECGIFFLLWDGRHSHKAGPTEGGHINPTCRSSVYDRGRRNGAGRPPLPLAR